MGRKMWRVAKSVLGLHMCTWSIPVADSEEYVEESDQWSVPISAPNTPGRHSSPRSLQNSIRVSKGSCAICLDVIKPGPGQALFTAECSHTFHFSCIVSNVRYGNTVCPVCRAKWKEVPWLGPIPSSPSPKHHSRQRSYQHVASPLRSFNGRSEEQDPVIRIIDESIANAQGNRTPPRQTEPLVYDDDETLAGESSTHRSSSSDFHEATDHLPPPSPPPTASFKLELEAFPEVGSVSYSEERNSFNVLVHLKAPSFPHTSSSSLMDPSRRAPIDLVTVLDVSGSMAGTKLILLKRAMAFVIRNLSSHDRLSVVVFSSSAKRLFPLKPMVEEGRQFAIRAIDNLVCTGGTNIAEGLRKGAKVLEERKFKNPVASIMLLSDGQDTYSIGTRSQALNSLESYHKHLVPGSIRNGSGVPVHTFGFGADHDATTMHSISRVSGGTFSFIQAEGGVQDAFAQCVGGLLSVVVQDVQLVVSSCMPVTQKGGVPSFGVPQTPLAEIKTIQAGSYRSTVSEDFTHGSVKLGDLYADEERDVLVELKLPSLEREMDTYMLLDVGCTYTDPVHHQIHTASRKLAVSRPAFVIASLQEVSIEVDRQKNRLVAGKAITDAGSLAETGDIESARNLLSSGQSLIRNSVAIKAGDKLSKALEEELGEIQTRLESRQMYESSGRAYILSAQSSHLTQRATTRGYSIQGHSQDYQTPSMTGMILRSQQHLCAMN